MSIYWFYLLFSCSVSALLVPDNYGGDNNGGDVESKLAEMERKLSAMLTSHVQIQDELRQATQRIDSMEKQIQNFQRQDVNVAFFAYLSADLVNPPAKFTIKFDEVQTNVGNAYDPFHGIFVAPINGSYHFNFIGSAPDNSDVGHGIHIYLMKNGRQEVYTFLDRNYNAWVQTSAAAVLHLAQGDRVWMEIGSVYGQHTLAGHRMSDNATHTHFSGFMIHAD